MNIDRRLEEMRNLLKRSRPCLAILHMKTGETVTVPLSDAIEKMQGDNVADIEFEGGPEGQGLLPHLLKGLCHPAPDRRISDYE